MKRFWKDVAIDADRVVTLDGKPVRTPGRRPLALPSDALAEAVAAEWRAVGETIDPRTMPLTGLANAATDPIANDPAQFAARLAAYGESDLLCYRAEGPRLLIERQAAAWDPLLAWARGRYDVTFAVTVGVMHVAQPDATVARLHEAVAAYDDFRLAGLSPVVTLTGSLVIGLALIEGEIDADAAWAAAGIDEDWSVEMWGEDWQATQLRELKRKEFGLGVEFLGLL
ncbi:chaperone required for assembly of F1-ATPase [Sphingomonas sp. PP-F2F-G114-C0414]|uniref:ATP12 family chaperone protein n=1 Tax=Sphingomonas sp. PP-F2F-G114-C0414 TaxID=2135662 RepID=UPI000EF8E0D7|nr:ATP12 family protein [Sphingomonas sp. PP-F2F-G114-C0414]RMB36786.1 chaperone required for assembly of F1-ATPase [Sphingomonas sp. PP-F2F-G114-C0414]